MADVVLPDFSPRSCWGKPLEEIAKEVDAHRGIKDKAPISMTTLCFVAGHLSASVHPSSLALFAWRQQRLGGDMGTDNDFLLRVSADALSAALAVK